MAKEDSHYYSISDLADEFNISTRTIRYYEEVGLIQPNRDSNNQRRYHRGDRARLKLILRGKKFGFSLEEIKEMIELFNEDRSGKKQFRKTIEYGNRKIAEIENRIQGLEDLKNELLKLRKQFEEKLKDK